MEVRLKMELTLHTETVIDSSHYLKGYDGKCAAIHGHSWKLQVWIKGDSSQCDDVGILFDFGNIKKIQEKLDHKLINTISPFDEINPTAENLSIWIYNALTDINFNLKYKVRLYETAVGKETYCECGDF
jgi:6-pyruvoyltetrahydropterin/6-carboxytetrahydropterin synthase